MVVMAMAVAVELQPEAAALAAAAAVQRHGHRCVKHPEAVVWRVALA